MRELVLPSPQSVSLTALNTEIINSINKKYHLNQIKLELFRIKHLNLFVHWKFLEV